MRSSKSLPRARDPLRGAMRHLPRHSHGRALNTFAGRPSIRRSLDYHGATKGGCMAGGLPRGLERVAGCLMALLPALAVAGAPAMETRTASAEFDRLFVLAQTELEKDKVDAITDWSF